MLSRHLALILWLLLTGNLLADGIPDLRWQLVRSLPRLPNHFTQGLVFTPHGLYESTGRYGQSRLVRYDRATFEMREQYFLPADRFAEGLTFLNHQLYQSTWTSGEIHVYAEDMKRQTTLTISGQSWGLTTDGSALIMSDGSSTLQYLDPQTARVLKRVAVTSNDGRPWEDLNELEWVNGYILANVWHRDGVLVIDPATGHVLGRYNFEPLSQRVTTLMARRDSEQVLNGMAWNPLTRTLLVTGKDWPVWFEVALLDMPGVMDMPVAGQTSSSKAR